MSGKDVAPRWTLRMPLAALGLGFALAVGGCESLDVFSMSSPDVPEDTTPSEDPIEKMSDAGGSTGQLSSPVFANKDPSTTGERVGVNAHLWRASLDTLSFMPLATADAFGGVIITDWYAPPETPNERFKIDVLITTRELRADGIRVTVFRQEREQGGPWHDAEVERGTATDLEDTILTRAQQLRNAAVNQ